jgi:hypothetical protein
VTEEDLDRADAYEPVEYKRVAANLASGRPAWVYVDTRIVGTSWKRRRHSGMAL